MRRVIKINKYKHVRIKILERGARKRNFLYRIKVRLIRHSFKQYQKRLCTYIQKAKKIKINTFQNSSKKLKIKNNNLYFRRKMQ